MNWISLSAESPGVIRDENGVPVEWTLLRIGSNPICQEGKDGALVLTADAMQQILDYHAKKGELIPLDSEHYLYELANQKKLDEAETLKLFPGGIAALGPMNRERCFQKILVLYRKSITAWGRNTKIPR